MFQKKFILKLKKKTTTLLNERKQQPRPNVWSLENENIPSVQYYLHNVVVSYDSKQLSSLPKYPFLNDIKLRKYKLTAYSFVQSGKQFLKQMKNTYNQTKTNNDININNNNNNNVNTTDVNTIRVNNYDVNVTRPHNVGVNVNRVDNTLVTDRNTNVPTVNVNIITHPDSTSVRPSDPTNINTTVNPNPNVNANVYDDAF